MNIIFILTLVVCLLDLSVAARLRENLNVLVPVNDVNLQEKIKTMLNGDDVDPEDFSDNEIEVLSEMKNVKIEKLRNKSTQISNKVFDDVNKNNDENKIDRDDQMSSVSVGEVTEDLNITLSTDYTNSTSSKPSKFTTESSTITSTSNKKNSTSVTDSTSPWVKTTNDRTSSLGPDFEETTKENNSTVKPSTQFSTATPTSSSTIRQDIPILPPLIDDDFRTDECLLGKADRYLPWLKPKGGLNEEYINTNFGYSILTLDLSRKSNDSNEFEALVSFINNTSNRKDITVSLNYTYQNSLKCYHIFNTIRPIDRKVILISSCSTLYRSIIKLFQYVFSE